MKNMDNNVAVDTCLFARIAENNGHEENKSDIFQSGAVPRAVSLPQVQSSTRRDTPSYQHNQIILFYMLPNQSIHCLHQYTIPMDH